jgi:peptidoglycan/LPS O-acetylase OafA/YrhL
VEALFYLLLPICAGFYFRRPVLGLVAALVIQTVWRAGSWRVHEVLDPSTPPTEVFEVSNHLAGQFPAYAGNLALGMTAAWVFARVWQAEPGSRLAMLRRWATPIMWAGFGLLVLTLWVAGRNGLYPNWGTGIFDHHLRDLLPPVAFAVMIVGAALCTGPSRLLSENRVARWLGKVSYGTYLWHVIIIFFLVWSVGWLPERTDAAFFKYLVVVLPVALAAGWMSYEFVERPSIAAARRYLARRKEARAEVVAPRESPTAGSAST